MEGLAPTKFAAWQTGLNGIDWVHQLVKEEKAISLGGDGYPYIYMAMAKYLKPVVLTGPPQANAVWGFDHGDILAAGWVGRTGIDRSAWEACDPDEWLTILVYDQS